MKTENEIIEELKRLERNNKVRRTREKGEVEYFRDMARIQILKWVLK